MRFRRSRRELSTPQHRAVQIQREVSAARVALLNGDADEVEARLSWIYTYARAIENTPTTDDHVSRVVAFHGSH